MSNQVSRRRAAKTIFTAAATGLVVASGSQAAQPHMDQALVHLRAAADELTKAQANKGGHRVKAMKLIEEAIEQVKAGIAAAS